jgi:hypothetical protein
MLRQTLSLLFSVLLSFSAGATVSTSCSTTGPQEAAVILVNLPNYSLPNNATLDYINGILFGNAFTTNPANQNTPNLSLNDFLVQNSNNQINLDTSNSIVIGPYTLPHNYNGDTSSSTCDVQTLKSDAMAAAVAANPGLNLAQYSRLIFVTPNNGSCNSPVRMTMGCTTETAPDTTQFQASETILFADYMTNRQQSVTYAARAFGYNLGLNNGRMRICNYTAGQNSYYDTLGALGNSCLTYNFSDPASIMGATTLGFYSASQAAEILNWLQSSDVIDNNLNNYYIVIPNSSQNNSTTSVSYTYTIQNYEGNTSGIPKALKIQRGTGNNAWLWVEARSNTGNYDSTLNPQLFNGALIHYKDSNTQATGSDLLDFTPLTASWNDATLAVGQTWKDPYSNLVLTVNSETNNSLTVTANYLASAPTCIPTAPIISISPASVTVNPGSITTFNVTVTNPTTNCLNKKYLIYNVQPAGWNVLYNVTPPANNFNDYFVAGESKTYPLTVPVPVGTAIGQYGITAKAQDATNQNNVLYGLKTAVIYIPATLSVTVNGTGTVTSSPAGISCPGTCSGQFKASSNVYLTATPGGTNNTVTWTGSDPITGNPITITGNSYAITITKNSSVTATFSYVKPRKGK